MFVFNDTYLKDNDYLSVKSLINDDRDFDDTLIRVILMRIGEEK